MKRWQSALVKTGIILTYLIPQTLHGITEQERIQDIKTQIDSLKSKPKAEQDAALKGFYEEIKNIKSVNDELAGIEKWNKAIKTANGVAEKAKKGLGKEIDKRSADMGKIEKAIKGINVTNTSGEVTGNLNSASQFQSCRFTPDTSYEADINAMSSLASSTKKDLSELVGKEKKAAEKAQEELELEGIAKLLASRSKSTPAVQEQVKKLAEEKFPSPEAFIDILKADKKLKKEESFQAEVKAIEELATFLKKTRELKKGDAELSAIASEKKDDVNNKGTAAIQKFKKAVAQAQFACQNTLNAYKKMRSQAFNGMTVLNNTQNAGYDVSTEMTQWNNGIKDVTCDATTALQQLSSVQANLTAAANKIGNEGQNPSKLRTAYLEGFQVVPEGLKKASEAVAATLNAQCGKMGDIMKKIENDPSRQTVINAGKGQGTGTDANGATASAAAPAATRGTGRTGANRTAGHL